MEDLELVNSIQQGDEKAFEMVFRSYYQGLCSYAYSIVKDHDQAEEIVQNMFCYLWANKEKLSIRGNLASYLFPAVKNRCLNLFKHFKVRESYASTVDLNPSTTQQEQKNVEFNELEEKLYEKIESLPEARKKIFKMSRFEGKSYKEIADELSISIKTVENQMGKALGFLRIELSEYIVSIVVTILFYSFFF